MIDCHVHTDYTIDAIMTIEEAVEKAVELELDYMCFTQHIEPGHLKPGEVAMDSSLIDEYFKRVEKASDEYGIQLGVGVEVGYVPETYLTTEKILDEYSFDFVIGSIHELNEGIINGFKSGMKFRDMGEEKFIDSYFDRVDEMIEMDYLDIVGHLDVFNKYEKELFGKELFPMYYQRTMETGKLIKKMKKGFEVNTQGIRRIGKPWPREELVKGLHDIGINIVSYGSDAHETDHICYAWNDAMNIFRNAGFEELVYFVQRKRKSYKIPKKA